MVDSEQLGIEMRDISIVGEDLAVLLMKLRALNRQSLQAYICICNNRKCDP